MTAFHTQLDMSGHTVKGFSFTMAISGVVTNADVGKPVAIDPATPNTVRIAANNDIIFGRLETLEVRPGGNIGSVSTKFIQNFTLFAADPAVVGDTVIGAAGGTVKKAVTNDSLRNVIMAKVGQIVTVAQL